LTPASNHTLRRGLSLDAFQAAFVWLLFASSFYVKFEPAPVDLLFILTVVLFLPYGLAITPLAAPMILLLVLYNVGGVLSYVQVVEDDKARMFVVTSAYMAVTAMFFAFYVAKDPPSRMALIRNGWIVGGVAAAAFGIAGAMDIAGLGAKLSLYGRAMGMFKDPNVLSTYLLVPAIMLVHSFLTGTQRHRLLALAALGIILAALFLSFSRGAWISFILATALMALLSFLVSSEPGLRGRIVLIAGVGLVLAAILMMILLSVPKFSALFFDRLTLVKSYDAGETGRFGRQLTSLSMLLEQPLGFGPVQFRALLGQDPHNTFLNAFASYGWLGGLSYLALIVSTIAAGIKAVFTRTPWQAWAIVIFCPLLTTILQGVQIDTDHWRHFYWLLGMIWGLFAASMLYRRSPAAANDVGIELRSTAPA
jgi:hypothetical protein